MLILIGFGSLVYQLPAVKLMKNWNEWMTHSRSRWIPTRSFFFINQLANIGHLNTRGIIGFFCPSPLPVGRQPDVELVCIWNHPLDEHLLVVSLPIRT